MQLITKSLIDICKSVLVVMCFMILGVAHLQGQDCGCLASGTCPSPIPNNTTGQVCYNVVDLANANLSSPSQGVCGVKIRLRHNHIWDLSLSLVSPSGQIIQLMGPQCPSFTGSTSLSLFDVTFVPSSVMANPDVLNGITPCSSTWNNCTTPTCFTLANNYIGSYYPFSGNLEDFNLGSINGNWCLNYTSTSSGAPHSGNIFDFEIIPCDPTGQSCCDAESGNLGQQDTVICSTVPIRNFSFPPTFPGTGAPNPANYGYLYVLSQNDIIQAYQNSPNANGLPNGVYKLCGLSYLRSDTLLIPSPNGSLSVASLRNNLTTNAAVFCGEISNNCVNVTIVDPPPTTAIDTFICEGTSITYGSTVLTQSGLFNIPLVSDYSGCDSLLAVQLTVIPKDTVDVTRSFCDGGIYVIGIDTFRTAGNYEVVLSSSFGCDSLIRLDLAIFPQQDTTYTTSLCQGDTLMVGDSIITMSGNYVIHTNSFQGCDSIIHLTVNEIIHRVVLLPAADTLDCLISMVSLDATASTLGTSSLSQWFYNGMAIPMANGLTFLAQDTGWYALESTNGLCVSRDSVYVYEDYDLPLFSFGAVDTLTCTRQSITLSAQLQQPTPGLLHFWSGLQGQPIRDSLTFMPTMTQDGSYVFQVTNPQNACVFRDTLQVFTDTIPPTIAPIAPLRITCAVPTVMANPSIGLGNTVMWSTLAGGVILNPTISSQTFAEAGNYQVLVNNPNNGCQDSILVDVTIDTIPPPSIITTTSDTINCVNSTVILEASSGNFTYQWSGGTPAIPFGNADTLAVTTSGIYQLLVTDNSNGCQDSSTIEIYQNLDFPVAIATNDASIQLNCFLETVSLGTSELSGLGTSVGPQFVYEWTSNMGGFASPTNEIFALVDTLGWYFLSVTDTVNGCTAIDSVFVNGNLTIAPSNAGTATQLDCNNPSTLLNGSPNGNNITTVAWYDENGIQIATTDTVRVFSSGTYFYITNFLPSGCSDTSSVFVDQDSFLPRARAGADVNIDCCTGEVVLNGSGSSVGSDYQYRWTTSNGSIVSGSTSMNPTVNMAGTYVLEVTYLPLSCSVLDSVNVLLDLVACLPIADAGIDTLKTCKIDTLFLGGPSTSLGCQYQYQWFNGGTPIAPGGNLATYGAVDAGTYILQVTNPVSQQVVQDTVIVMDGEVYPILTNGPTNLFLNCSQLDSCIALTVNVQDTTRQYQFIWATDDGRFCTTPNGNTAGIQGLGIYNVDVIDIENGCPAATIFNIVLNGNYPVSEPGAPYQIPCTDTLAVLDGSASFVSGNGTLLYQWSTVSVNTSIETDPTQPVIEVYVPPGLTGVFDLEVTNTFNGCTHVESVNVFGPVNCEPICDISQPTTITCVKDTVHLSALNSSIGSNFTYRWLAASNLNCGGANVVTGTILSGDTTLTPTVGSGGCYQLSIRNTETNYQSTCFVQVAEDKVLPIAEAGPPKSLNCRTVTPTLDGTGSSVGAGFLYQWSTTNGCLEGVTTNRNQQVSCIGNYQIQVTNAVNGCTSIDNVMVTLDTITPNGSIPNPLNLGCTNSSIVLTGVAMPNIGVQYQWFSTQGHTIIGSTTASPIITQPGDYCMVLQFSNNGCRDTTCVVIGTDGTVPSANAGATQILTCLNPTVQLQGSGSVGGQYSVNWFNSSNQNVGSGYTTTVSSPGQYSLEVLDLTTNCKGISFVMVADSTQPPLADAGMDKTINCSDLTPLIDGSSSSSGPNITYQWSQITGNVSGGTSASLTVGSTGAYFLEVENIVSGCSAIDTVFVDISNEVPIAEAGQDTLINCNQKQIRLNGQLSSQGDSIAYSWTGPRIISGNNTVNPLIDASGWYHLTVTNVNSNCSQSDSVFVNANFTPPIANVQAAQSMINCKGPARLMGFDLSGLSSVSYQWFASNGAVILGPTQLDSVAVNTPGMVSLVVRSSLNGCLDTMQFQVMTNYETPSIVTTIPDTLNCLISSTDLMVNIQNGGIAPAVSWSSPCLSSPLTLNRISVSAPCSYEVVVTNSESGCTEESTVNVYENKIKPVANATVSGEINCTETSVELIGTLGPQVPATAVWQWLAGPFPGDSTNFMQLVSSPGSYYWIATALQSGCKDTAMLEVVIDDLPIGLVDITINAPDCDGSESGGIQVVQIAGGTAPYLYSLNNAAAVPYPSFNLLSSGTYVLMIEDSNGCQFDTTVTIPDSGGFTVDLGEDLIIPLGDSAVLSPNILGMTGPVDSMYWAPTGFEGPCTNCLQQTYAPMVETFVTLFVWDENGCLVKDEIGLFVEKIRDIGIPSAFSPNGDNNNDFLEVFGSSQVDVVTSLQIFDRWGNMVYEGKNLVPNLPNQGWDGNFNGQPLNPQVFVWKAIVRYMDGASEMITGDVILVR